ncbi:MAG: sulfatase-like hydrolase/transferase [Paludibacter sp.]|jgi:N-acetylgalactosamine-6-sulfatase|nr:sulfatase-like hydrolase/transferase [Paludibacter sp.]
MSSKSKNIGQWMVVSLGLPVVVFPQANAVGEPVNNLSNSRPNIIFIFADDWGFGDLGVHGHKGLKTPHLDKMASEGIDFHQFYVCSPVSSSSRTALITGQFPSRHLVHEHFAAPELNESRGMPNWLNPAVVTLPKLLKQSGYKTAHFGKWHLSSDGKAGTPLPVEYGYHESRVYNGAGPQVERGPAEYPTAIFTENSVNYTQDFIRANKNSPFFVNLWIHETHQPIEPSPEMRIPYKDVPEPQQSYYSVVSSADKHLGRLFQFLKDEGLDDNTLVVFSSDNGPEHNNAPTTWNSVGETAGLKARKRSLYNGGVKVPFIVRFPGVVPAGKVDSTTVLAAVDILPTLCDVAGVNLPEGYVSDGEKITDALIGKTFKRNKPIFQYWQGSAAGLNWPRLSVIDGKYKLLMTYDKSRIELYDHLNDWGEMVNLAEKEPSEVARLSEMCYSYYHSLPLTKHIIPGVTLISAAEASDVIIYSSGDRLHVHTPAECALSVFRVDGKHAGHYILSMGYSSFALSAGFYIIRYELEKRVYYKKIQISQPM